VKLNAKVRVALVLAALAATLGAVRWSDRIAELQPASANGVVQPAPRATRAAPAADAERTPPLDLSKLQRPRARDPAGDLFDSHSYRPASPRPPRSPLPQAEVVESLPAPPQAPPLPFTYLGRLTEEEATTVFLAHGDRNLVVKPGDVIDNLYRVEDVSDSAVALTYLPLNQRQVLATGVQ
jgi:hypothetical protein